MGLRNLSSITPPEILTKIQSFFPKIQVGQVPVEWSTDKSENTVASATGGFFGKWKIVFNPKFVPAESADFGNLLVVEGVIHELVHIQQSEEGFFRRLKMWWDRQTKDYLKRESEIEARNRASEIMRGW